MPIDIKEDDIQWDEPSSNVAALDIPESDIEWEQPTPEQQPIREVEAQQPNIMDVPTEQPEQRSLTQEIPRQLGLTLRAGAEGLAETAGVFYDPLAALTNVFLPKGQEISRLHDQVKGLLDQAGVPDAENQTERIVQQAAKLFTGAGAEAAAGAKLLQKGVTGAGQAIARGLAEKPAEQMTAAAAGGLAQQAVAEQGGGTLAQLGAGLLAGGTAAGIAGGKTTAREIQSGLKEAEELGIDVMTTDVLRPRTMPGKLAQGVSEMIPITGTGPVRKRQYGQRLDAIKGMLRQHDAEDVEDISHLIAESISNKAKQDLTHYDTMKKNVIKSLDNKGIMPVNNTLKQVDTEIAKLNKISPETFAKVTKELDIWKNNIKDKSIADVEELRKVIGQKFTAEEFTTVKDHAEKAVNKIYNAINQDMGQFIKDNGQRKDFLKWKIGNKRISNLRKLESKRALKQVLKDGSAGTKAVKSLIFSTDPTEMKLIFKTAPPEGKEMIRSAVLKRMLEKSGKEIENLSADQFKQQLKKEGARIGAYFKGPDLQKMEGLRRALVLTEQSGAAGAMPKTGYTNVPFLGGIMLTDYMGGAGGAAAAAATAGMIARVFESKPVRDLAMKIPRLKDDPIEEAAAVERLLYAIGEQFTEKREKQQ